MTLIYVHEQELLNHINLPFILGAWEAHPFTDLKMNKFAPNDKP